MSFLRLVCKKTLRNIGLVLCLLAGLIVVTALITSVPVYTDGMMEKTLIRELEQYQIDTSEYPGNYTISCYLADNQIRLRAVELEDQNLTQIDDETLRKMYAARSEQFDAISHYIEQNVVEERVLPIQAQAFYRATSPYIIEREEYAGQIKLDKVFGKIQSMSDLYEHIIIVDGEKPSTVPVDGVYEVLVTAAALQFFDIPLGQTMILTDPVLDDAPAIRVRPVGVFQIKDPQDLYWGGFNLSMFRDGFLMDAQLFSQKIASGDFSPLSQMQWYLALDYHEINSGNMNDVLRMYTRHFRGLRSIAKDAALHMPARDIIGRHVQTGKQIETMMLPLYMSVFIMLCLYFFMVSRLIVDKERNEIALIASRGAQKSQILIIYFSEFLFLSLIAMAAGPALGLFITKILGASNGFLDFVNRKGIPVELSVSSFLYAGSGMALSMLMLLVPAWSASRTNIVAYKQKKNFTKWTLWEKIFLDLILLLIAAVGYFLFKALGPVFSILSDSSGQINTLTKILGPVLSDVKVEAVTPFLFVIPSLFIIGAGLLFIRLYPLLVRGIYRLGRSLWPPTVYHTLNQVSKGFRRYHFLMIFLIMTLSTGIFSATAARTINQNDIDKIYYAAGCDMVIDTKWEDNTVAGPGGSRQTVDGEDFQYKEPPFLPFTQLPGVAHAARVRVQDVDVLVTGNLVGTVTMMGIDPHEFSRVVWYRPGLFPYHINDYLRLLTQPSACLVSRQAAEQAGVRIGDTVEVAIDRENTVAFTVYAFIDCWPSFNSNQISANPRGPTPALMVTNLSYVQNHMPLRPWSVWLKLNDDATSSDIYQALKEQQIPVLSIDDPGQEVIAIKNKPSRMAINGILTLSFLISGLICFIGFLLFWILTVRGRVLEFGVLRSMGLSTGNLIGMMGMEQVMTSLTASGMGILIGLVTSKLFIPFFQIAYSTADQVPPFSIISFAEDRVRIYIYVGVILAVGLGMLGLMLSRINMNQALKLGED